MNMTYRSKKQITKLMASSSQLLTILMSKLRGSLGAAWEQAGTSRNLVPHEITARCQRDYVSFLTGFLRPFSSKRAELERRLLVSLLLMLVLGSTSVWGQGPVEITTDADITNNTKKLYLIQTNAFQSFYIAPQSNNNITTNNILGNDMLWYFLNAGVEDNIQYYYIVNNSTGKYISHGDGSQNNNTSRGVPLVEKNQSNDESCKFRLDLNETKGEGFYNIKVKGSPTYFALNKRGGSVDTTNPIQLTSNQYINDIHSLWKFIPFNGTFVWPTPPFTPSTDSDKHFYKIRNIQNNTYYVSTDAMPDKVTYASTESDRMVWYLKEAPNDPSEPWFKYYYIINPSTGGRYMYYNGTATNGSSQTKAVSVKEYDSANEEDRYQFVVIQAARGDGEGRVECYAIIPKLLTDKLWGSNSIGLASASISDGANMGIISSRGANNNAQWEFKVTDYSTECATPTITFSNTTGKVTITTTTSNPSIYYTTNGTIPSSTNGTPYSEPFVVTEETTIKAIVTRDGFTDSEVTTETFYQVTTPTIQNNGSNAVSITSATEGATIYYTIDDSNPTTSSTVYSGPLSENISGVTIKAIAVKDGMINSAIGSGSVTLSCATPVFTRNGNSLTISCPFPATGVSIYYTKNGGEPTTSSTQYTGAISVDIDDVIKAIAVAEGYNNSEVATKTVYDELLPIDGKYYINNQTDFEKFVDMASSTQGAAYHYILKTNVDAGSPITVPFTGVFEVAADENGNFYTISGLTHPLFNTIDGGVVKNAIFSGVDVKGNGTVCNEASGATKIYNCGVLSGTVTGSGNVGGLVGHITNGSSVRVINCYNFAQVIGGSIMGGIVGNNEGTVGDVRIAMCMMYGDMPGGTSPVYAGNHTSNASNFTEYNYWRSKANLSFTTYNDQLAIDNDEYLTRFPFYRHILNTHRELAAYFLFAENTTTGSVSDITAAQVEEIGHWSIDKSKAIYPIIEKWEKNTKKVLNAPSGTTVSVRKGDGTPITSLKLKVIIGSNTYTTFPGTETELTLPITDMDEENHDYTWGKVVLPFANEFEVNTNYDKICTGWKITAVEGGNGAEYSNYNMSDRECTAKDLYSNTGFIFAQGGYYIVPYNVTKIEITANFANAFYLSDESYDISYSGDNTTAGYKDRTGLGGNTPTTYHEKPVYNTLAAALGAIETAVGSNSTTGTTHEQAVVLVGNYHQDEGTLKTANGYTIMSIDADNNQEPDYAIYSNYTTDRPAIPPTRFDFVAMIPVGMSAHVKDTKFYPNIPIFKPRGWFELTETSLLRADQFELDSNNFNTSESDPKNYRCIINGGYFTQMVRSNQTSCTKVSYFQIGGKAYVKEFYPGNHSKKSAANKLVPVNVTGGEIEQCFMTGYGLGTAYGPDIYFWCAGGKIGKFLGAYMEKPKQSTNADGNVNLTAKIDHAIIGRFFGGGTSPSARVTGNINVTIDNSRVDFYCGGPEFGDMTSGKTVSTEATNTYFKEYYGAGFGGTGITYTNDKDTGEDLKNKNIFSYNTGYFNECYVAAGKTDIGRLRYKSNYGIGSCYKFEFVMHSRGYQVVSRFFTGYARFSLASTGNVTNILNGCEIEKDFYGAGCQGKVNGTVTSTLTGCTVHGSAFGGGYKAESNQVDVYPAASPALSTYNSETCLFSDFGTIAPETYEWVQGTSAKNNIVEGNKLYTGTDVTLTDLGNVTGAISLTIDGGSVTENVYGGGNESKSLDNTSVTILNGADISGDVFGAGKGDEADETVAYVTGSTAINMSGGTVAKSVYGGGQQAQVGGNTDVAVSGGTIGTENFGGMDYGNVYGGGKGSVQNVRNGLVKGNTKVTIENTGTGDNIVVPFIRHNVYGGGAYGSVGTYTYASDAADAAITGRTSGGKAEVVITGGTFGTTGAENGMIFGSSRGDVGAPGAIHDKLAWVYDTDVKIGTEGSGTDFTTPTIKGSVYGGGENGHVFTDADVYIYSGTVGIPTGQEIDNQSGAAYPYRGNVYGAGCGTDKYTDTNDNNKEKYNPLAGIVQGNTTVNISGGHVVRNVYGAGAMGSVGTADVATSGKTTVTVSGGRIGYDGNSNNDGNIFGAARGDLSATGDNLAQVRETEVNISYETTPTADNEDKNVQLIAGSVFGGGEAGKVKGSVAVNMTGGLVLKDVYGGGALADTQTSNWDATANQNVGGWADTNQKSALNTTTVRLTGGTILGEAYGGALGQKTGVNGATSDIAAYVYGDVLLDLNGTTTMNNTTGKPTTTGTVSANTTKGCVVGQVFGCNNINGSPKGDVMVHVYATQNKDKGTIAQKYVLDNESLDKLSNTETDDAYVTRLKRILSDRITIAEALSISDLDDYKALISNNDATAAALKTAITNVTSGIDTKNTEADKRIINSVRYDMEAVYGGGNMATYVPVTPNTSTTSEANGSRTQVIIEGCDKTSIETVYGGGNAAAVPETNVKIKGAYEIGYLFGGGNGYGDQNPGADIGQYHNGTEMVTYGTGNANSRMEAGLIHEAYGGSNTKGVLKGSINQVSDPKNPEDEGYCCELVLEKIVGAGKYADIDGDVNMTLSCQPSTKVPLLFAGADEANVNGNITLNITNGNFGKVFGGNNLGGAVKGKITVNVEETGCQPIKIDELYLGGNQAAYSIYGYYESEDIQTETGKKILKPRTSATDSRLPVKHDGTKYTSISEFTNYAQPELNIISCTYIGEVFGGGLGAPATMYANPSVNVNMVAGEHAATAVPAMMEEKGLPETENTNHLGIIGNVYGGGQEASVIGETHVNIGTEQTVGTSQAVLGAYITGNVYGGGKLANVGEMDADIDNITAAGRTFVNIGAKKTTVNNQEVWQAVAAGKGVTIKGNVYGGGKGEATTFKCEKAMVAGSTNIMIGNGTVNGVVYGGGQLGRVETGTTVTIGIGDGEATGTPTSEPQINGDVYGAGAGVNTHGYAALVRGISEVTIQGNAKVGRSVYGGGQIASVGRYKVKKGQGNPSDAPDDVEIGMPYTLADSNSKCIVTVKGYAEIGPDNMQMKAEGGPDDTGYVFGAGKGVLPYEGYAENEDPVRWTIDDNNQYVQEVYTSDKEDLYLKYVGTLALATETEVTIGGHAFVKGSVYGGSENGHVQHDTNVKIEGNCQIGNGWNPTLNSNAGGGVNERYNENLFVNPATATAQQIETAATSIYECAHWDYTNPYTPYDKNGAAGGGATTAKDGHTFYGNVFGGGSGLYPYKSRKNNIFEWLRTAGRVEGNTNVIITGGHILTSVYGGCELTDVGNGVSVETNKGRCFVKMSGGTLGVPRTLAQIAAHPVTCYLFGAGKGDQRVHFDQWTNVGKVRVEINDSISQPIIYGSAFGGGEDGHVLGDVSIDIKTMNGKDPVIGTWGTSYVDGNVFGGGRGFGGDALTAGVVSGNVYINISGGKMLGSIYGGGRLGSVGTYLVPSTHANYGKLIDDGKKVTITDGSISETTGGGNHGHITIDISGGTIGNSYEYVIPSTADNTAVGITETDITKWTTTAGGDWDKWKSYKHIPNTEFDATSNRLTHTKGGNVFAGAMGRFYGLDGSTVLPRWIDLGKVKSTKLNISGSAVIKSSIYGGGELGWTEGTHTATIGGEEKDVSTEISISGGTIGTEVKDGEATKYTFGSVFGGGYGSSIEKLVDADSKETNPKFQAGRVKHSTKVDISGGTVLASVYGGGEVASVGYGFQSYVTDGVIGEDELTSAAEAANTYVSVSGNAVIGKAKDETNNIYYGGATMGNVYGGGSGNRTIVRCGLILGNTNVSVTGGTIYHNIYGGGAYGSVGNFEYDTQEDPVHHTLKVYGVKSLKTTGTGTAKVTITGGNIGIDGRENGMVFGSSRGDVIGNLQRDDYMAWVNEANVTIGTSGATTGPTIAGSVYGSGENGHTLSNTNVAIHSGTIGILTGSTITGSSGKEYNGAEYPYRGNVYGGGCGTDTYTEGGKTLYNPLAGLVKGNATVTMDGGRVARTIYGGGAMGSVGTFTYADADYHTAHTDVPVGKPYSCTEGTGLCTVTISGGSVGPDVLAMPNNYGNVFGAGRGEVHDPAEYANLETSGYVNKTLVTVSGSAFVRGSVYGGAESGHVLADTHVKIQGGQIGCGKTTTEPYGDNVWADTYPPTDATDLECASWPYEAPYTPYDKFADENGKYPDNSSADNAHPTGTDGHTFYGNVFGGGSGYEPYAAGKWLPTAGWVEGNTTVEITGGHILTSVYGGNEMTDVGQGGVRKMTDLDNETPDMFYDITKPGGKCTVKMSGGTLGVPRTLAQIAAHPVTCYLFGAGKGDQRIFFNKTTNVNNVEVEISGTARIYGSVFGGGEDGHVMRDVKMTIKDNAYIGNYGTSYVEGNVFGGGRGFSGEALTAGNVGGCVEINIQGGTMLGSVYGGGRLGSVGYGLYLVDETVRNEQPYGVLRDDNVDDRGKEVSGFNRGYITINISGGTIGNNIEYKANPTAADKQKMPSTTFDSQNHLLYTRGGNVFAGCMGRLYSLGNTLLPLWPKLGRCKQTTLNITGGTIKSNVYGGAELGVVEQNTSVNITGGQVGTQIGTGSGAYYYGSVFGSGKGSNDNITYPSTTPEAEQISISEAGTTGGNVEVHLNKDVAANTKGGIVRKVFGCNDMNGTPKGDVLVHIHATQSEGTDNIATKPASGYDVDYVFGGGNNADYVPTVSGAKQSTEVIIEGCDLTSIEEVYGGGFGAATPGTKVEVRGTKIINNVFGGGYGAGQNNPGANVGIRTDGTTEYGNTGAGVKTAVVRLMAGNVHNVYGGSNTKGDIRGGSSITNIDKTGSQGTNLPCCDNLNVNNIYGGGKDAEMAGGAEIVLGCMPNDWISEIYAGAENADVGNDVSLTLTSGKFGRVFGGNKSGGRLHGGIIVNIEENGDCGTPIIIGELYGGGNEAPYSIYGYKNEQDANGKWIPREKADFDAMTAEEKAAEGMASGHHHEPQVNVRAFTSIGNIYGGGYGSTAVMVGNPSVNINEVQVVNAKALTQAQIDNDTSKPAFIDGTTVRLYPHESGKMGVIGNVFGGGNAAKIIGNTTVNVATKATETFDSVADDPSTTADERVKTVVGADIRGNVYGGGNNAEVTGNTNVNIGKKEGN